MALYKGKSGKISVKEGTDTETFLAHTTNWSVDSSMEIDETAYFGGSLEEEGTTEKVPGLNNWTASFDGAADYGTSSGQDGVFKAHNDQTLVTVRFYLNETTGFTGEGYIDSYSGSHAADGKGEFSASIAGNGKLAKFTTGG